MARSSRIHGLGWVMSGEVVCFVEMSLGWLMVRLCMARFVQRSEVKLNCAGQLGSGERLLFYRNPRDL